MLQATMPTLKLLPVPIGLPFFRVDVSAARASLTGIGRRNKHNRNTSYCSFVSYKNYELVERPVVRSSPLSFVSRFGIKAFPNSGQVLKCQRRTRLFCLLYQLLADVVIHPFLEPALSARKPSHQATCRTSAFGLNVSPDLAKSVTNRLNLTPIPGFSPRSSGNVAASEIDPNHLGCFACRWRVNLNHKVDVVVALARLLECCTGHSLTSKQGNLIPTDGQLKINPSTFEGHSYNLFSFHVPECPNIQTDGGRPELVDLFNCFGVTNNATDSLTNMISFQSRCGSYWLINLVVKRGCVPAVFTLGYFQYLIASVSKSPQSFIDLWSKLYRHYNLALYRQGLSHVAIIIHTAWRRLKPLLCVSPSSLIDWVSHCKNFMKAF